MKKHILILVIAVTCLGAEIPQGIPVQMSPRRLWRATPDDVTSLLINRANNWLVQIDKNPEALVRALEVIDIIALLDRQTLLSDEYNPNHMRVLRFTPQYIIEQFNSIADVYEQFLKQYSTKIPQDQQKNIAATIQAYRDAASLIEYNSVLREEPKK